MKRLVLGSVALLMAQSAFASSYVTGNVQFHDSELHGSSATSTLEAGHTFTNSFGGLTVYTEFDGIQIGDIDRMDSAYVTVGGEQAFSLTDNLWVAAGYQHLLHQGSTLQYRPLVKIGYNMDKVSISHRSRFQFDDEGDYGSTRTDTNVAYQLNENVNLKYNLVYTIVDEGDNSQDHELRATWTRNGVQPYFEYRNQADNENNAIVFGASYGF